MKQTNCSNGHIFDADIYGETCPYCENSGSAVFFSHEQDKIGKTMPPQEYLGKSEAQTTITPEPIGATVPPESYVETQQGIKKTVGVFAKKTGSDPVVGWLVCIAGHDEGKDYRLCARTNTIGRGEGMDVRIKGDDTISGDTHAKLDYDILNNNFYLLPGNNRNTIYLNKAPVYAAAMLKPYDAIRFGQTDVMFVPFCSEKFVWPSKKDGEI